MSASMTFSGHLCFRHAHELATAESLLGRAVGSVVSSKDLRRRHLLIELEVDTIAPAAMWDGTLQALGQLASMAWSGHIDCCYERETKEVVVADARRRALTRPQGLIASWAARFAWTRSSKPAGLPNVEPRQVGPRWARERRTFLTGAVSPDRYQFAFEDCEVLTLYRLTDANEEPGPSTPSYVYGAEPDGFMSDRAPYITIDDLDHLEPQINRLIADATPQVAGELEELLAWIHHGSGWIYAYQLEPAAIAGDGSARARGLEAEDRSRDDDEPEEAASAEPNEPWPMDGIRYRCPRCGSNDVRSQYTSALGPRFTEVICEACGLYGDWTD